MKKGKCAFFKQHIQYLGYLIFEAGFELLPKKLESIRKMPAPKSPKEVKQFLGLIGYYRKFVPHFLMCLLPDKQDMMQSLNGWNNAKNC